MSKKLIQKTGNKSIKKGILVGTCTFVTTYIVIAYIAAKIKSKIQKSTTDTNKTATSPESRISHLAKTYNCSGVCCECPFLNSCDK